MWISIQKSFCVEKCNSTTSCLQTQRFFVNRLSHMRDTPKTGVIMRQVLRSRSSVTLQNQQKSKPKDQLERRTLHIPEKVNEVTQDVARSPKKSFRVRDQQLGLEKSILHEFFTQDFNLYLYQISIMQVLQPADK